MRENVVHTHVKIRSRTAAHSLTSATHWEMSLWAEPHGSALSTSSNTHHPSTSQSWNCHISPGSRSLTPDSTAWILMPVMCMGATPPLRGIPRHLGWKWRVHQQRNRGALPQDHILSLLLLDSPSSTHKLLAPVTIWLSGFWLSGVLHLASSSGYLKENFSASPSVI